MNQRKMLAFRLAALCAIGAIAAYAAPGEQSCQPLSNAARLRLAGYVKKKYKLPEPTAVVIKDVSLVPATCFRKITFAAEGGQGTFRVDLFASPDLRFLTRELLDSTLDPILEERRTQQTLAAALRAGNPPAAGPKGAPVTIVLFSDFQCPYCADLARILRQEVLPAEKNARVVFRHFPLGMHDWALPAAQAATCAQQQGDEYFWRLHDYIFERQKELTRDNLSQRLVSEAGKLRGFDRARFTNCLARKETAGLVAADMALGTENGVRGTPTLFVNGRRAAAISSPEQLRTWIRESLH